MGGESAASIPKTTNREDWKENAKNKLAIATIMMLVPAKLGLSIYIAYALWYSPLYPIVPMYLFWMYVIDRDAGIYGRERKWNWWRSLWFFKRLSKYFPQEMIKTADLPPDDNYLLCIFPHGIFPSAAASHFCPTTGQFYELFPGLNVTIHALDTNLKIPVAREFLLGMGYASCSQKALLHHLNKPKGQASLLYPGGIAEGLICEPNHHRVLLKNRKGFIRVGLLAGTNVVPIYSFGESDLYHQKVLRKGDFFYDAQQYIRKNWQAPIYLARGVGLFQNFWGLLPRKLPVYTVVGAPIKLPKIENVKQPDIDYWHSKFVEAMVKLFEEHKHKYVDHPENTFLEIE